ncbi:MAG: DMT family transporter [Chloroflexi bacterium]|nr:DMT family transporter [Chloroflexota bacterium]
MVWIVLSLISAASYGTVAVMDKRLLDRHMPSLSSYFLWVGVATLIYGVIYLGISGFPEGVSATRIAVGALSGLCWGGAIAMMFWGFKLQEVSRASAVLFTFPVFVALFASIFLGESLAYGQWLAIGVVVFGALLMSLAEPTRTILMRVNRYWKTEGPRQRSQIRFTLAFPVLIGSSLLTAAGHLTGKYALQELSVPMVTSMGFFGTALVLAMFWRPRAFREIKQVVRSKEALLLLLLSEGILIPIAVTSMIAATKLGPISLVATVAGTRPIFVFLYSTVLSMPRIRLLNESLDRRTMFVKIASVAMIITGIMSL